MKKTIIAISAALLFGVSIYTVNSYNKNNTLAIQKKSQSNTNSPSVNVNNDKTGNGSDKLTTAVKIKAEDFKLKDLNGKEVSLSDFKGKNVFLNFWATWCPPCRAEMPEIEEVYESTKASDLVILAVNLGEDAKTVRAFASNNKYNFNILLDSNEEVAAKYNISSIPTSYFIDEEGNIKAKKIGAMNLDEMKFYVDSISK